MHVNSLIDNQQLLRVDVCISQKKREMDSFYLMDRNNISRKREEEKKSDIIN